MKGNAVKKLLVTGGCGFIGTNFIKYVLETRPDWQICNLDKLTYAGNARNHENLETDDRYTFVRGDINDRPLLETLFQTHRFDGVIHFAAESHVDRSIHDPSGFVTTNVNGTCTLLEASRRVWESSGHPDDFRFVHVSTDEVYGSLGFEDPAFEETTAYAPSSPYSASKAASDHFVKAFYKTYGFPAIITNCSNNYGPYQFPEKLIPLTLLNITRDKPIPIYGSGENVRDWLYVLDHCEALVRAFLKGKPGQTYNIGGGEEKQNIEVVKTICSLADKKLNRSVPSSGLIEFTTDRKGHDLRYAINPDKTAAELGWTARYTFEDAISKTIDWYIENMDWVESITSGEYLAWIKTHYGDDKKGIK